MRALRVLNSPQHTLGPFPQSHHSGADVMTSASKDPVLVCGTVVVGSPAIAPNLTVNYQAEQPASGVGCFFQGVGFASHLTAA